MSTSPTDPAAQSQASISPQSNSMTQEEISLETLVSHLLASKRSLSSISTVWRANEIVTSARSGLEDSVILSARTGFLKSGILEQVKILRTVRSGIENVYKEGQRDFKSVIRTLDAANSRLEATMDTLRSTMVAAGFRPENEEPRSLLDFVDEQNVEVLRDGVKELIRESKEAQTDFDSSILSFEDDLRALKTALRQSPSASQSNSDFSSPIPPHLNTLETHAQEMASLLDALVSHFDLCVTAIRHTEGGYAAVRKAASSLPAGVEPVSVSGVIDTENIPSAEEAISDEERQEMLDVLVKDAAQVEDVVLELRERLNDMETMHEAILEHVSLLTAKYNEISAAYNMLEAVGARLQGYVISSQDFRLRWEDTKLNIQEQLTELETTRLFYENYFTSYDGLILEVHRRKASEDKIKAIMRRAMEQIEKEYEVDKKQREEFKVDIGEFLPADLWPGISAKAPKWKFGLADEDGGGEVPDLEKATVEAADRRDRQRQRTER